MKNTVVALSLAVAMLAGTSPSLAGGKPEGARCHVHKSCQSRVCSRPDPTSKFGVCCAPKDCTALGAQCGTIGNGCGLDIDCGQCDPGSTCEFNACVTTTTTTTTTTSTTTTTTSTTTSTTLGCIPQGGSCQGPGDTSCCGVLECVQTFSGGTGYTCENCVETGESCDPAGLPCCAGSCISQESQTICAF